MANYGKQVITQLATAMTLPNALTKDTTAMAFVGGSTNGALALSVYAVTAFAVATAKTFSIELQSYSADTAASAIPPFSTANTGLTGTAESDAHYYVMHKTAADGAMAISAGSLITQCIIPQELLDKLAHDWVQLTFLTDEDLSAQTVDVILHPLF
jgi:hypothetical protein